ncbi:hypothetical protein [Brassicibacter mesophilus]|uniref:hypothetical protein n=1 Tax=Brassicibacter mesophilus TaxID=745119 RepID=UPI003D1BEA56
MEDKKMGEIIKTIEKETYGMSFKSYKYCHDTEERSGIQYDDNTNVEWKEYGETEKHKKPVNLKLEADRRKGLKSIFTYFLDGSRHTYKIDDMSYNKNVYPVLAGQVGVGCCKRENKKLSPELFYRKMVIVLPNIAFRDGWDERVRAADLLKQVNGIPKLCKQFNIQFDDILTYTRDKDDKLEKKGVAVIQDYMVSLEKDIVAELVLGGKLNQDNYLIKDGSIDYQKVSHHKNKNAKNLSDKRIANYYKYVIGVSKSFDPTKCFVKGGGSNSDFIAQLKPFERTPAYMYQSTRAGEDVYFCIWYLRLREARYTQSIFDGVVKIEKLVVKEFEKQNGIPSDEIDNISAFLLNERNPVCYGTDSRWANHIYPVYLTESFVKSKYLSNNMFMKLF